MADDRHFKKSLNRHNSAMFPSIFTKFDKMTHFGRLYPVDRKNNSEFLQSKMDGHHLKPDIERVQALADVSRSRYCHRNETPTIPPSYIRSVQ